jgi:hypothetical protein
MPAVRSGDPRACCSEAARPGSDFVRAIPVLALACLGIANVAAAATAVPAQLSGDDRQALMQLAPGDAVAVGNVPIDAARTGSVRLRRIEVYDAQARIYVVDASGSRELPRSTWRHFIAQADTPDTPRMALSLAPDGRVVDGLLLDSEGQRHTIVERYSNGRWALELVDVAAREREVGVREPDLVSGPDVRMAPDGLLPPDPPVTAAVKAATGTASRQAVVAIDTDNELLLNKFGNNTTNATNYLAALFTQMNVIYERDLDVTLVQGTTFLRPSTMPDPYAASGPDTGAQLDEFSEYWRVNNNPISRAFALQLSGKSSSPNSSSGVAWLVTSGNYCTQKGIVLGGGNGTFGHYGINRVFLFGGSTAANDVLVTAHELGHIFGANHTHCTDATTGFQPVSTNTIDSCVAIESGFGCFGGAVACPAPAAINGVTNVRGTLMSYCHFGQAPAGCTTSPVFAPRHQTVLLARIATNVPTCITPTVVNNQAPSVPSPASSALAVTEDQASSLAGIVFADPDAATGGLTATFTVAQGTLAANAVAGITIGGTTTARTLGGQLAALNAYLAANNLTYTTAGDATAAQVLAVQINDNGNTGAGGALTGNRNVTLNVSAVNDPPSVAAPASFVINEDVVTPLTGITLADVDAGAGSVQLTAQTTAGTLTTTGSGVTVGGSGTATVTLTGSIAAINTFVANSNLRYTTAQDATASATLNVTLSDLGNTGSGGTLTGNDSATLNVTAVNDAPAVAGPTTVFAQLSGQTTISGVSFNDVDAGGASLTVTWAVGSGTMSATAGGGVTVSGSGSATLTTSGTLANLNAFVSGGNVRFTTPGGLADITLTVTANDNGNVGSGGSQSGNRQITLSFAQVFRDGFENP